MNTSISIGIRLWTTISDVHEMGFIKDPIHVFNISMN